MMRVDESWGQTLARVATLINSHPRLTGPLVKEEKILNDKVIRYESRAFQKSGPVDYSLQSFLKVLVQIPQIHILCVPTTFENDCMYFVLSATVHCKTYLSK